MRVDEYIEYDGFGLSELIRGGEVEAQEIAEAARSAIASVSELNALAFPLFEEAIPYAAGPLAGVPFLMKDDGPFAAGYPFTVGSRLLRGAVADRDSIVTARARAAGLAILGATAAPEFCISFATDSALNGPTRNPWDPGLGVGGSSGGSAALVAARAVPWAHASDGAGSIRVPSAACGVVGFKPSRGRVPVGPYSLEAGFGVTGHFAITRTLRDVAALLDALAGDAPGEKYRVPAPHDPYSGEVGRDSGPLRIAVSPAGWYGTEVNGESRALARSIAAALERRDRIVDEVTPAFRDEDILDAYVAVTRLGLAGAVPVAADLGLLEAATRAFVLEARQTPLADAARGFDAFNTVAREAGAFFERYDLLITPTLAREPIPHGTLDYDDPGHTGRSWMAAIFEYGPFTSAFNLGGQPAVSLPLGMSSGGLPLGVQLVAAQGREDLLIRVAAELEARMPWAGKVPVIVASG